MNEDDKNPKKAFNLAAEPDADTSAPDSKEDDDRTVAKKDNTQNKINPPTFAMSSSPSNAPTGSVPVDTQEEELSVEFTPDFTSEEPEIDLSIDHTVIDGKTDSGVEFLIKQEDDISSACLDGGRISRLTLIQDGVVTAHFDNEWIINPETPLEIQTVDDLQDKFGDVPKKEFKSFNDLNKDIDNDPEI